MKTWLVALFALIALIAPSLITVHLLLPENAAITIAVPALAISMALGVVLSMGVLMANVDD